MSETTYDGAYLPSVYQNAYQYSEITEKAIVYKNSNSTFASLMGSVDTTDDNNKVITWDNTAGWQLVNMATASGGFNWQGSSTYEGLLYNDGSSYKNIQGMSTQGVIYAVTYDGSSEFSGVALNTLATQSYTDTITVEGNYVVNRDASGAWTYVSIPDYIADPTLATSGEAYVYVKDADGNNSFVRATPTNLYGQILNGKIVYVNAQSTWAGIDLPTPTDGQTNYYHLVATNNGGTVSYEYIMLPDSPATVGFNRDMSTVTVPTAIAASAPVTITDVSDSKFVANMDYTIVANFDVYVADITKLVSSDASGVNLIAELPVVTVKYGTTAIGTYIVKPNQPLQSVCISKVITSGAAIEDVIVEVAYNGAPETVPEGKDLVYYVPNAASVTMTPCGHPDVTPPPEQPEP